MNKKVRSLFLCLFMAISLLPALSIEANAADVWDGTSASTQLSVVDTSKDYNAATNPLAISSGADLKYLMQQVNANGNIAYTDSTHAGGSGSTAASSASCRMTANIILNDESFSFDSASGIVTVTDGPNTGYLGTGVKGITYNTATASTAGSWYSSDALTGTLTTGSYGGTLNLWTPIGISIVRCFSGTFDGGIYDNAGNLTGYHTIAGIYINNSSYNQGLFGNLKNGSVQNTGVINSYIKGGTYTGSVVGSNNGTVSHCYNSSTVNGVSGSSGIGMAGGVVGTNSGTVSYCYNAGSVNGVSGDGRTGGVVGGNNNGTVSYCYNTGTVTVSGSGSAGGVVGGNINTGSTVQNCYNTGSVTGYSDVYGGFSITCNVGGVVGSNGSTVQNCYNMGSVSGINIHAGGVVGTNSGTVSYCYNTGSVNVSGVGRVGGVVGDNYSSTVSYCYNTGSVSVSFSGPNGGGYAVGGVVGNHYKSTVAYCYNTGSISFSGIGVSDSESAGGVVGRNISGSTVQNCYNTGSVSISGAGRAGGVEGYNYTSTANYCYYDKQMCITGGTGGSDLSGSAEGRLTYQMVGNGLKTADTGDGWTGDHWVFTEYLYPRLKNMNDTDAALLSALPLALMGTETVNAVKTDFALGGIANGVIWTSSNTGVISVSGGNAAVVDNGSTVLTATLGGVSKTITLTVDLPIPVNIISAMADGMADTATSNRIDLTFDIAITGLSADDITITSETGAAVKGALTGSGTTWSIALTSVTAQGNVSVAVAAPTDYSISGSPITVAVYKEKSITNAAITPNIGSFDKNIANQMDVQTTVTWNDAKYVSDIKAGSTSIGTSSYSVSNIDGSTAALTIKKEYLATQSIGNVVLTVEFDKGGAAVLTVAVVDMTVPVATISVAGTGGVSDVQAGNTLQMLAAVLPGNASNQDVTWSIESGNGSANISTGGLLTTTADGIVIVRATAQDASGVYGEAIITVSAAPQVTACTVTFNSNGSTYATKTVNAGESIGSTSWPSNPTRNGYTFGGWFTEESGAGSAFSSATPVNVSMTVYAKWTAAVVDTTVPVATISVAGTGGVSDVQSGNTLQMLAAVLPGNASNQDVTWSIESGNGSASISTGGLLTTTADGIVIVRATAQDTSGVYGEAIITVSAAPQVTACTVTFNSNGSTYATKTVNAGESIGSTSWPSNPTRNGYTFGGWFTEENGAGSAFSSATPVNVSMTVYAKWINENPGTGDNGDGGGSSTNSDPAPTEKAEMSVDGTTLTTIPVDIDRNTNRASINIGSGPGGDILGAGNVVIDLPSIHEVNSYTLGIPVPYLSKPERQGALAVNTGAGNITVSANMLTGITGAEGSRVEISLSQGDKSSLPETAAIGDRPLIRLSMSIDGRQIEWDNPGAPVTISIPYTPTAAELANPESIIIWYIDGSGNAVPVPNGHYNPANGTVTFTTTHFSYYAVGYNQVSFNDITAGEWYHQAVSFIAAREIATGTGDGNFSPDTRLTRGQFIVLLMRAYDIDPDANQTNNFSDAGNTYYTGFLAAAKRLGLSAGVGNNMFAPEKGMTRQEMFTMLYNTLKVINRLPQGNSGKQLSDFSDAEQIAPWAKKALELLVETGTVGSNGSKLSPAVTTTRTEIAQMLYNLLSK